MLGGRYHLPSYEAGNGWWEQQPWSPHLSAGAGAFPIEMIKRTVADLTGSIGSIAIRDTTNFPRLSSVSAFKNPRAAPQWAPAGTLR